MAKKQVFVMLGQSNALGHGLPMAPEDRIETPLNNVWGLHREPNQRYDPESLCWSGYTSCGMNVAETQDHTYSVPNILAKLWQAAIDSGKNLPDLYIVQVAIGAQGVYPGNMWHPDYPRLLIPGKLGTVKMALYPLTMGILSRLSESLGEFEIMGIHWRGNENDAYRFEPDMQAQVRGFFEKLLAELDGLLAQPPVVLHALACPDRFRDRDPSGRMNENMDWINGLYEELAQRENVSVFDVTKCPEFIPNVRGNGIFKEDMVHFTASVNHWAAQQILTQFERR